MKLNAYISRAGVCSRRKAVDLVKRGEVRVNNAIVTDPSYEVRSQDLVAVDKQPIKVETNLVYIMLNKPKGVVTTAEDELGRKTVLDLLGDKVPERVYPVGRLDRDTTGLLLLTNDGDLAHKLAHPSYEVSKTYQVVLDKDLQDKDLARIQKGVYLEDGRVRVDALSFCSPKTRVAMRVVLHSGKKRVIRRLFERLGYEIKSLDRVVYAGLTLQKLSINTWRELTKKEVAHLQSIVAKKKTGTAR
jgi:23S rRNA pseudouridine2605 synthase